MRVNVPIPHMTYTAPLLPVAYETVPQALGASPDSGGINLAAGAHGATTYIGRAELLARSCAASRTFRRHGVEFGDRVLTLLPTGTPFLLSVFGAWYAGAATVPLACPAAGGAPSEAATRKLAAVIRAARPNLIVASRTAQPALAEVSELTAGVPILTEDDLLRGYKGEPSPPHEPSPDDIAHIQFTSGSTSLPKGSVIRHRNLAANLRGVGEAVEVGPADKMVSWLPIHHDMGFIGGLLFPLFHGLDLKLIPTETFIRNPAAWLRSISDSRATLSPAPTFAYDILTSRVADHRFAGVDLSSWRIAWVGAEPIFLDTLERFQRRFEAYGFSPAALKPCYGLAESTLAVSIMADKEPPKALWVNQRALRERGVAEMATPSSVGAAPIVCVGSPLTGTEVRIVGPDGRTNTDRQQGRIQVRGTSVMSGYVGDAESPFDGDWLETGDLGFCSGRELYITGRTKDLIIRGGVNIHPQELERAAQSVGGVRLGQAAAFSVVWHEEGREEVVLVVETKEGAAEKRSVIVDEVMRETVSRVGVRIDRVELVPPGFIPKTTSGKIQRAVCRDKLLQLSRPNP